MLKRALISLVLSFLFFSLANAQKTSGDGGPKTVEAELAKKLAAANLADEKKLRKALRKSSGKKLKILTVRSEAVEIGKPRLAASIIYDASSLLRGSNGEARAVEAEKLLAKVVESLLTKARLKPGAWTKDSAKLIYRGQITPSIGEIRAVRNEIRIVVNLVVKDKQRIEIVAFADISTDWLPTKK